MSFRLSQHKSLKSSCLTTEIEYDEEKDRDYQKNEIFQKSAKA